MKKERAKSRRPAAASVRRAAAPLEEEEEEEDAPAPPRPEPALAIGSAEQQGEAATSIAKKEGF
jgi:hypothetical protein